ARMPKREIVALSYHDAPAEMAKRLGVEPGAPIIAVFILGKADGVPVGMGGNYFSLQIRGLKERFEELQHRPPETFSFFDVLESLGVSGMQRRPMRLRSRGATAKECERLGIPASESVIETESLIVDGGKVPAFFSTMAYPSSRVEFVMDL